MARGGQIVAVPELNDFIRDLRAMDADLPKELRKVNKEAAEFVADKARAKATSLGGVAAKAAASIRAAGEQRRSLVKLGGARAPWALGANFGAAHDQERTGPSGRKFLGHNQFPGWVGKNDDDRFMLSTARDHASEFLEIYADAFDAFAARVGEFR